MFIYRLPELCEEMYEAASITDILSAEENRRGANSPGFYSGAANTW